MRILSLRGGGIRGLACAVVLEELERRTGKPCHELFNFITGTSTGGILAIGLALGIPAAQLADFYFECGPSIFRKRLLLGLLGAKYDVKVLHNELAAAYKGAPLHECKVPAMVTMTSVATNGARFAKSWKHGSLRAADAATATAAAPTFFAPWEIATVPGFEGDAFRDGGMFGNNPAPYACVELLDPEFPLPASADAKASVRFASAVLLDLAPPRPAIAPLHGNGILQVAPALVSLFMDSGADANATVARRLLGEGRYLAVSGPLGAASPAMDDASARNLQALAASGRTTAQMFLPAIERLLA